MTKRSNNPDGRPVERSLDLKRLPCSRCGKTFKADKFRIIGPLKNRRHSWCGDCEKEVQSANYEARKKRLAAKKPKAGNVPKKAKAAKGKTAKTKK